MSTASNFFAYPSLRFTLSQSYTNGPVLNFSASLNATRSIDGTGTPVWGISTSSIDSYNYITLLNTTLTGGDCLILLSVLSQSTGINIFSSSQATLNNFISSSSSSSANVVSLFSTYSIDLR